MNETIKAVRLGSVQSRGAGCGTNDGCNGCDSTPASKRLNDVWRLFTKSALFVGLMLVCGLPLRAQLPIACGVSFAPMVQPIVTAICQDIAIFQHIANLSKTRECEEGFGDGTTALPSGPHTLTGCLNNFGGPYTVQAVHCITDNAGTSTLQVDSDDGTHITSPPAFQCGPLGIGPLQANYVTLQSLHKLKFTFNSDGQTKSATFVVTAVIQ